MRPWLVMAIDSSSHLELVHADKETKNSNRAVIVGVVYGTLVNLRNSIAWHYCRLRKHFAGHQNGSRLRAGGLASHSRTLTLEQSSVRISPVDIWPAKAEQVMAPRRRLQLRRTHRTRRQTQNLGLLAYKKQSGQDFGGKAGRRRQR